MSSKVLNDLLVEAAHQENNLSILAFLIEQGADVNCRSDLPVRVSVDLGNLSAVKFLVASGASIKEALMIAKDRGFSNIVAFLEAQTATTVSKNNEVDVGRLIEDFWDKVFKIDKSVPKSESGKGLKLS